MPIRYQTTITSNAGLLLNGLFGKCRLYCIGLCVSKTLSSRELDFKMTLPFPSFNLAGTCETQSRPIKSTNALSQV